MHVPTVQETELSVAPDVPGGSGVGWMLQLVPSQLSARISTVPEPVSYEPTPVHAVDEVHETPSSPLPVDPPGSGVLWTLQLAPSHTSARVSPAPPGLP